MRILITEEALESGKGHWPSYIGGLAGELRGAGDEVDVLIHRDAGAEVCQRVGGTPWFSRNCWMDRRSQGKLGGLLHNWHFRRDTLRWLANQPVYDWVFALTMRLQHLVAFAVMARAGAIPQSTRFLLLFVQGFGRYCGPDRPGEFPSNLSTRIARLAFRWMAPAVRAGRVVLAAETQGMQDELQRFTGLPVALFPHPVEANAEKLKVRNAEMLESRSGERPITLTCPGFARYEKGNDLMQEAIKQLLASDDYCHLRFVMQWPQAFTLPDGSACAPDPTLAADERVEFVNHSLDSAAYEALLARTDLVVLPYRRESYHNRLSRVAIEAASRGIPLVCMSQTWCDDVLQQVGSGVAIADETPQALANAIREAVDHLPALQRAAAEGAGRVINFHSAAHFRRLLV